MAAYGDFSLAAARDRYDRRSNSRSPRPAGWTATSMDEQADDVAGLLRALDLSPVIVFGTSAGANILSNLVLRHPAVLRAAIFHEPVYVSVTTNPEGRCAQVAGHWSTTAWPGAIRRPQWNCSCRGSSGSRHSRQLILSCVSGCCATGHLVRSGNGHCPGLSAPTRPVHPDTAPLCGHGRSDPAAADHWRYEAALWLARQLDTALVELPGAHMLYLTQPLVLAEALRHPARQAHLTPLHSPTPEHGRKENPVARGDDAEPRRLWRSCAVGKDVDPHRRTHGSTAEGKAVTMIPYGLGIVRHEPVQLLAEGAPVGQDGQVWGWVEAVLWYSLESHALVHALGDSHPLVGVQADQ